jgi:hypothetical protein
MEDDNLSFTKIIRVVQNQTKMNTKEILKKYKISPNARRGWLFHCARWFPCWSCSLFSRLISWRWSRPFTWDIGKVTRFFICFWQTRRARSRMFLTQWNMWWSLGCWKWMIWEGVARRPKLGALLQQDFFVWDENHQI